MLTGSLQLPPRESRLLELFASWAECQADKFEKLPPSGSNRVYYRLAAADGRTAIGVVGENNRENAAFISFSKAFAKAGLNVPRVFAADEDLGVYIQQDLGSTSLFDLIQSERKAAGGQFTPKLKEVYKKVLASLVDIQVKGRKCIDFSLCYPRSDFDTQSMMWDLQYFKYYFLRLAGAAFDEERLEADFNKLVAYLLEANSNYFLYRDMQSRNVMLDADFTPWFVDFQGGRRGARQYDVASLLYDAKADIPNNVRNELLAFYVSRLRPTEVNAFLRYFYGFCLIRIMQAMGAYGYRGYFERKAHFLKSIPFALDNVKDILEHHRPDINAPELFRVLESVASSQRLRNISASKSLKLRVFSFSYKHGIPVDVSGNGGGHVFDCRALPNPGREERYKHSTGRDADVIAYFERHKESMESFLSAARSIVSISVENYLARGFNNLMVSFGCTGGQHRSVFCAESIARWAKDAWPEVDVELKHIEQQ
ncbi:MAG: phosphotransferase [Marinilabiliaceae bacterium]